MNLRAIKLAGVVLFCAVAGSHAFAAPLDDPATARKKYDFFKASVTAGDLGIDWQAFRLAATVAGVNGGFEWQKTRNDVFKDLDEAKNAEALSGARSIIDHNMANPEGHLLAMAALQRLGKDDESKKERAILAAIVKSITDSGDGKSAATAWFTVDPSEEYFVISTIFGAEPKGQALVQQAGHAYDKMTIVGDDGKEQELWFNTDTDMQIMSAAMSPKPKP